jgi:hypothetical protein
MHEIIEYIFDNHVGYRKPNVNKVSNQKQLLNLPWVKAYMKHPKFNRFVISKKSDNNLLMVIDDRNSWWWAVALLPKGLDIDLPEFNTAQTPEQ